MSENQLTVPEPEKLLAKKTRQLPANTAGVQFSNMDEMYRFAVVINNSGLAPNQFKSPEALMIAIQHGLEIGLKPMQAIHSIAVINGRPCIWGDAALAVCKAHPAFENIEESCDGEEAVCTVTRAGQSPVTQRFSMTDAKRAGLVGKAGPWTQYPRRMLQMRARSWAIRDAFPDALKGIQVAEEVQDYAPRQAQAREVKPAQGLVLPDDELEKVELLASDPLEKEGEGERDPVTGEFLWK